MSETKVGRKTSTITFPTGEFTLKQAVELNQTVAAPTVYLHLNKRVQAGTIEKLGNKVNEVKQKGRKQYLFQVKTV